MLIAHLTDIHLDKGVPYYAEHLSLLDKFLLDIQLNKVEGVLITGDLCGRDAPHRWKMEESAAMYSFLRRLSELCPVLVIRGNHDPYGQIPLLANLSARYPITAVERPELVRFRGNKLNSINVVCLPYLSHRMVLEECLGSQSRLEENIEVATRLVSLMVKLKGEAGDRFPTVGAIHHSVTGATVGSYEIQLDKDVVLDLGELNKLDMPIFAGHIHATKDYGNVRYAGSPAPLTFGEDSYRGYILYELDSSGRVNCSQQRMSNLWEMNKIEIDWDGKSPIIIPDAKIKQFVKLLVNLPLGVSNIRYDDIKVEHGPNTELCVVKPIAKKTAGAIIESNQRKRLEEAITERAKIEKYDEERIEGISRRIADFRAAAAS